MRVFYTHLHYRYVTLSVCLSVSLSRSVARSLSRYFYQQVFVNISELALWVVVVTIGHSKPRILLSVILREMLKCRRRRNAYLIEMSRDPGDSARIPSSNPVSQKDFLAYFPRASGKCKFDFLKAKPERSMLP